MGKGCTLCGEGLGFWDRIQGRIDHQGCWEKSIVKPRSGDKPSYQTLSKFNVLFRLAQIFYPNARTSR